MKNTKYSLVLKTLLCLLLFSSGVMAAMVSHVLYQSSGTSKFKLLENSEGARSVVRTSQNYDLYRKYSEVAGDTLYLVSSAKSLTQYLDAEGMTGAISWSVRTGSRLENVLWSKSEVATELNVHGMHPVLVSGLGGCCGDMTGYRLFNIENGRLLMSFNDFSWVEKVVQPISLEVPNSSLAIRYLGALTQDSTRDRDFVPPVSGKLSTLLLKYASESLRQKLQVDMEVATGYAPGVLEFKVEVDPAVPGSDAIEINGNQIQLWNIDGTTDPLQIGGVFVKVVLEAGLGVKTLKIPIKQDRFDLGSALIPAGVTVRSVPL